MVLNSEMNWSLASVLNRTPQSSIGEPVTGFVHKRNTAAGQPRSAKFIQKFKICYLKLLRQFEVSGNFQRAVDSVSYIISLNNSHFIK